MLCLGKVDVVRNYDQELRSASWSVKMPAVIRLRNFVRKKRLRVTMSRRNIFLRDNHQCQYCGLSLPLKELTCDHVKPKSQGGGNSWENIVAACGPCNRRKGGRTPEQAHMRLAKKPRRPEVLPPEMTLNIGHETPPHWSEFLQWMIKSA